MRQSEKKCALSAHKYTVSRDAKALRSGALLAKSDSLRKAFASRLTGVRLRIPTDLAGSVHRDGRDGYANLAVYRRHGELFNFP